MKAFQKGFIGDDNTPDVDGIKMTSMGIRISPLIDLSPALDVLDEINSCRISKFSRPLDGTEVKVYSSLDEGSTWDITDDDGFIQNAEQINDTPSIMLKYVIQSQISQILPSKSPKLYSVVVTLSDKDNNEWSKETDIQLNWG